MKVPKSFAHTKFITDANGDYRFDNVETDGFYTVSPSRANYSFTPGERSFSQLGNQTEAAFTVVPNGAAVNLLDTSEYFVKAAVPTPGYSHPELVEYIYVQPPPDGIYDFDFYAMPPSRPAAQVITKISMHYLMDPTPSGLTGVRIHASNNAKVAMLTSSTSPSTICVKGTLTNEGVECQAFRSTTDELFTLVGNLHGFKNGDEVVVCGAIAEISFCMQGTIINVSWIGKDVPRAAGA